MTGALRRAGRQAVAGLTLGLAGAALGSWPTAAGKSKLSSAPPTAGPATSPGVEVFEDWKRVCETPPGTTKRVCFVFQKVNFAQTDSMLLQAVVGYFRSDLPDPVLILTAPLGTFLPPGIELRVGGSEPLRSHFEVCMAIGCQASIRLDAPKLALLFGQTEAEVVVRDGAKKQVSIPLSLKGLDKGVASLKPRPNG